SPHRGGHHWPKGWAPAYSMDPTSDPCSNLNASTPAIRPGADCRRSDRWILAKTKSVLSGSLDRPALQALLVQWLRQGKLEPSPDTSTDTADIEMAAHRYLARALEQLA